MGYQAFQPFSPFLIFIAMKINNIQVVDNVINITLDENASVSKLYVDCLYNKCNKYSTNDEEHDYVFDEPQVQDNVIKLELDKFCPKLDTSAFTVLIDNTLGFYYDKKELYYRQIELLTNNCNMCLDKENKDRIALFILKKSLMDYALENDLLDDAIDFYIDLARMLSIDLKHNSQINCTSCCCRL